MGVPHGPHLGIYQRSIGIVHTRKPAVTCEISTPSVITPVTDMIEDKDYRFTWVRDASLSVTIVSARRPTSHISRR